MSKHVVTTELVADEPLVVVLHQGEKLAAQFVQLLSELHVQVESYSLTEFLTASSVSNRVSEAYKVLWVASIAQKLDETLALEDVCQLLEPLQQKLAISFPVSSIFEEEVSGELPYALELRTAQTDTIFFLNRQLPKAVFLFGQDILDISVQNTAIQLLCQDLQRGLLYSPQTTICPQTMPSFIKRATRYFLQPQKTSVIIRGNSISTQKLTEIVKSLYQSYYFSPIEIQKTKSATTSPVPFSVKENFSTDSITEALQLYVQNYPSPNKPKVTFVWESLDLDRERNQEKGIELDEPSVFETQYSTETLELEPEPVAAPTRDPFAEIVSPARSRLLDETLLEETTQTSTAAILDKKTAPASPFDLNQEIQRVFSETHVSKKKEQTKRIEKKKTVVTQRTKKRTALFYGGLAFTGVGLGILSLSIIFLITAQMFKSSLLSFITTQVLAQDASAQTWDPGALAKVKRLENIVSLQVDAYSSLVTLPAIEDAGSMVELSAQLPEVSAQTDKVDNLVKTFYSQVIGTDSGDSVVTAENMTIEALSAREKLAALSDSLQTVSPALESMGADEAALTEFSKVIDSKRSSVQVLQQVQPLLGSLLGSDRKKTYAVILQNNQELRPTGGFIEDVALITFQNGTLTSSKVLNSYQIAKQLNGTVVPPEEITSYLRESDWQFYDSNWDPSFPKSAEQISWFLDKSIGSTVDGVITIDLYGIATILEATGPLELPEYNEVLTDKNIFDQFEFHSEVSLVNNSKDYRQVVFDTLMARLSTLSPEKAGSLFAAMQTNFKDQHMLAYFSDADALQTMKNLGWAGELLRPNCPQELQSKDCVVDTMAQVEANVGTNTANHYLNRTIDHSVSLTASAAAHVRTITFENTAQSDAWPKGTYEVFTRLYVPTSAQLGSILVDGSPIGQSDMITRDEEKHKVIGFYAEVPIKSSKKITVSYSVPYKNPDSEFTYAFFEQQQPGSGYTPFTLSVETLTGFSPTLIAPQAEINGNVVSFNKKDIGPGYFGIKFKK